MKKGTLHQQLNVPQGKNILFGTILAIGVFCVLGVVLAENTPKNAKLVDVRGIASWYGYEEGPMTANGEEWDPMGYTCASNSYPFGTVLKVTNVANGDWVYCRVNDRGGFQKHGRIIDLSQGAFSEIADLDEGVIQVVIEKKK